MKLLTVVMPTLNEKQNVEKFTQRIFEQQKNLPDYRIEVIISDSHSTDGTEELIKKMSRENPHIHYLEVDKGIGVGLIMGHKFALEHLKSDVLAQMDADGQVDADILPKLVKAVEDGYDIALGSRLIKGGRNELSFSRRFFTNASSWVCRILMGPWDIKEFTNSARAFTPELFKKINLERLPWKEKTFINQPAFLHEAVLAGAKYVEVPLVFKDRAAGYSKNKTVSYTYDVLTYSIEGFFHRIGLDVPFFRWSRKAKLLLKFGTVGFLGTLVDFFFYKVFINAFHLAPATAKGFSTEMGIINNFIFNNYWTFKNRKVTTNVWQRFIIFNAVSLGGLAIAVVTVKFLHNIYGDGFIWVSGHHIAYNNFYFFATIPPVMIWNFLANHFITWRDKSGKSA